MKKDGFDYDKAEADLYDVGCRHPEEIYEYTDPKRRDDFLREHELNPDRYRDKTTQKSNKSNNSIGCYLTTACAAAKHLPDNCHELETLRAYRDGYLKKRENGIDDIHFYYTVAPGIVESINRQPNADRIWTSIYDELISPCVEMIELGKPEEAYTLYKSITLSLADRYLKRG